MSKKDTKPAAEQTPNEASDVKYDRDLLVNSKKLAKFGLHKDILRAILLDKYYTMKEAEDAISGFLKSNAFKVEK